MMYVLLSRVGASPVDHPRRTESANPGSGNTLTFSLDSTILSCRYIHQAWHRSFTFVGIRHNLSWVK